jgi:hypothetical protein
MAAAAYESRAPVVAAAHLRVSRQVRSGKKVACELWHVHRARGSEREDAGKECRRRSSTLPRMYCDGFRALLVTRVYLPYKIQYTNTMDVGRSIWPFCGAALF